MTEHKRRAVPVSTVVAPLACWAPSVLATNPCALGNLHAQVAIGAFPIHMDCGLRKGMGEYFVTPAPARICQMATAQPFNA